MIFTEGHSYRYWLAEHEQGISDPKHAQSVISALLPKRDRTRNIADWLAHHDLVEEWETIRRFAWSCPTKKGAP